MNKSAAKYTIKNFVTPHLKEQILTELCITAPTYYSKINAEIGSNQGFETCQMLLISSILNRPLHDLITPEALNHYLAEKLKTA